MAVGFLIENVFAGCHMTQRDADALEGKADMGSRKYVGDPGSTTRERIPRVCQVGSEEGFKSESRGPEWRTGKSENCLLVSQSSGGGGSSGRVFLQVGGRHKNGDDQKGRLRGSVGKS